MKVLFVASECVPFVKTGGLADVVGALPGALAALGIEVRVLLPAYPAVKAALTTASAVGKLSGPASRGGTLIAGEAEGLNLLALEAKPLFDRPGNPYLGADGKDWPDNHLRFGAFCRAAAQIATEGAAGWRPDVVHTHDWQGGLVPAYLRLGRRKAPPALITIHNIAFQGLFPAKVVPLLGLPQREFHPGGFEFFGQVSFLKAGLTYAQRISTVSPSYARELTRPEFGMGLEGVIAHRRAHLRGILNGIDLDAWNPDSDPQIAAGYSASRLAPKAKNRDALAKRFRLERDRSAPLFCVISRLTRQKGLDLLLEALPRLLARGARLALLGSGDADLETGFAAAARDNPGRVGVVIGYDEPLSHLMQAGSDAILVPSRFEPCGLTQLYGLRYGTVPVVAMTGGLADTVIPATVATLMAEVATGIQFASGDVGALIAAIDRLCDLYASPKDFQQVQRNGMKYPVGWDTSAASYAALFAEAAKYP